MANEAASVAAEEAPATATESGLPDTPQLPKSEAQKAMKDPAKPQTPVASMDANKGTNLIKVVQAPHTWTHLHAITVFVVMVQVAVSLVPFTGTKIIMSESLQKIWPSRAKPKARIQFYADETEVPLTRFSVMIRLKD